MATRSTSFRFADSTLDALTNAAAAEGVPATALAEALINEGLATIRHPGVVFRGPLSSRRAALSAGPDVWEVVVALQRLDGDEEKRIALLAEEIQVHPRLIRIALDYAALHVEEIRRRIQLNEDAAAEVGRAVAGRAQLLTG